MHPILFEQLNDNDVFYFHQKKWKKLNYYSAQLQSNDENQSICSFDDDFDDILVCVEKSEIKNDYRIKLAFTVISKFISFSKHQSCSSCVYDYLDNGINYLDSVGVDTTSNEVILFLLNIKEHFDNSKIDNFDDFNNYVNSLNLICSNYFKDFFKRNIKQ